MIKFRNKTLEDYFIDPVTAVITNSKGEIQKTKIIRGRPCFKRMAIHVIQAHTKYGYKKGYDVHHLDENKMNNALSNLAYLTHSEHAMIHKKGEKNPLYGKHHSLETRRKMSVAHTGKSPTNKGKRFKWINNGIEQRFVPFDSEIPEGFKRGMLKKCENF